MAEDDAAAAAAAAAAGGGNGDGEWRWWWQDALDVSLSACVYMQGCTYTRAREYRDSSLKIQMEYRAFEERSARGSGDARRGGGFWREGGGPRGGGLAADEEDSAGTGDEGDISKIEY